MPAREKKRKPLRPVRFGAAQLDWVVRNRPVPPCSQPIHDAVRQVEVERSGESRRERAVFDAICAVVDDPFRACCSFDEVRGGTLRILVNPPERLYDIRSLWQARLTQALTGARGCGRVQKVVFAGLAELDVDRPERMGARFPAD